MDAQGLLVVIGGPTASGKTHVAATLAKHFGTEVISGDSIKDIVIRVEKNDGQNPTVSCRMANCP